MPAQEALNRAGQQYIAGLANTARAIWARACEFDHIDPAAGFAVFSNGNPFPTFLNNCLGQLREARAQYAAGGYVGLSVTDRQLPTFRRSSNARKRPDQKQK